MQDLAKLVDRAIHAAQVPLLGLVRGNFDRQVGHRADLGHDEDQNREQMSFESGPLVGVPPPPFIIRVSDSFRKDAVCLGVRRRQELLLVEHDFGFGKRWDESSN